MKIRKTLISILTGLCVCLTGATLLTACKDDHTHSYTQQTTTKATCTEKGVITFTCSCNDTYTEEIPALGHDEETHQAQVPTCTEIGWEEYVTCEREGCEYTTYVELPALDHDKVQHEAQAATCTEIGWDTYEACTRCDYTTIIEIPATGEHNYKNFYCLTCNQPHPGSEGLIYKIVFEEVPTLTAGYRVELGSCTDSHVIIPPEYNGKPIFRVQNFSDCLTLESIEIPDTVRCIESETFKNCANLTELILPNSINKIGYAAFSGCTSLQNINIPSAVTNIANETFKGCASITQLTIPDNVTFIGVGAFSGCSSLECLTLPIIGVSGTIKISILNATYKVVYPLGYYFGKEKYENSTLTTQGVEVLNTGYEDSAVEESYYIPNALKSVTVTKSVAKYSFDSCKNITSITLPVTLTTIKSSMFLDCSSLSQIEIPSTVTAIEDYAFMNCTELKNITIPRATKSIGWAAFANSGINNLVLNNGLQYIDGSAFNDCANLTTLSIPSTVKEIPEGLLSGCQNLQTLTLPFVGAKANQDEFEYPLGYIFGEYNYENSISVDQSYIARGQTTTTSTYYIPNNLTSVTITGSSTIRFGAFHNCSMLQTVNLPNVTIIGENAFENCKSLKNITLSNDLITINTRAFYNCSKLYNITIPNSVTRIGLEAFYGCSRLNSATFEDDTTWYYTSDYDNWYYKRKGESFELDSDNYNAKCLSSYYTNYYWYKK